MKLFIASCLIIFYLFGWITDEHVITKLMDVKDVSATIDE